MKNHIGLLLTLLVTATITACAPKAPFDNRWAEKSPVPQTVEDSKDLNNPNIPQLSIAAVPTESGSRMKPKDLPDHAGASYFEQLAKFSKTASEFVKLSGIPLGPNEKTLDTTSFDRTLVITVSKGAYRPGERIVRTRVTITPNNFSFSNYTIAATEYSTINIDNVTSTQSVGYGAELSPNLTGTIAGTGNLSANYSNAISNTAQISQRIEQLTVSIRGDSLIVDRESERGLDLTGNTLIRLSLKVMDPDDDKFVDHQVIVNSTKIRDDQGLLSPEKASISFITATITKPIDFKAEASIEYVRRMILNGASTYTESDDEIQWVVNPAPAPKIEFTLLPRREMEVPRWVIRTSDQKQTLFIKTLEGIRQVRFTDFGAAQELVGWLKNMCASKVGSQSLLIAKNNDTAHPIELTSDKFPKGKYPDFIVFREDR